MLQQVLDLDRDVVGQRRERRVELLEEAQRVADAVEEVRIAEGDVLGPEAHQLRDVLQHDIPLDDAQPAAVDGRDRAVEAAVSTAPARLDVAGQLLRCVPRSTWAYLSSGGRDRGAAD